jgi:transposase, IS5 family
MGPGKRAALDKNNKLDAILDEIEYLKASFRAKGSLSRL